MFKSGLLDNVFGDQSVLSGKDGVSQLWKKKGTEEALKRKGDIMLMGKMQ